MSQDHRQAVIDILNWHILGTFAVYLDQPVEYRFFDDIVELTHGYPAIVVKLNTNRVVGFAFLKPYHRDETFKRTAEIAYYLMPEYTRQGIGSAILKLLTTSAQQLGIDRLLASISSRNEGSLRFHSKNGFSQCGRFRQVGQKFGLDFDEVWMQWPATVVTQGL